MNSNPNCPSVDAREIDINTADMSELGSVGVDLSANIRSPPFRVCHVSSPLPDARPHDGLIRASLNVFQRSMRDTPLSVFKLLRGDGRQADSILKMFMHSLPRVVPISPDMTFAGATYACAINSAIQRIFVIPANMPEMAQAFKPFTWSNKSSRFVFFMLTDPRQEETFVAQSLFDIGIQHSVSEETLSTLRDISDGFLNKSGFLQTCIGTLIKLNTMWRSGDDLMIVSSTFLDLLLSWGVGISLAQQAWSMLASYFETITSYLFSFRAEAGGDYDAVFVKAVSAVIASVLAIVGTMALPSQKMLDTILKRTSDLGRASSGFSTIFELMRSLFDKVYAMVYEFIFGVPLPGDELETFLAGLSAWYDEVAALSKLDNLDDLVLDCKLCRIVEKLHATGSDYCRRMDQFKLTTAQRQPFLHFWRIVVKVYDRTITHGARNHSPRTEPLIIHLFGESSVGKSGLTYLLAQDLLSLENLHEEIMNEVYFRNVEQEFWDGYHGQAICVYDDFGQVRDSASNPNKEFMEIIRTGNIAPWPLHMAQLEEKARTRFTSRACILTSNQKRFSMDSLTHTAAFMRRIDLYVKVSVAPEYALPNGRIDSSKVSSPLDPRVYQFTLFGEDSKPLQRIVQMKGGTTRITDIVLNYDEFSNLAKHKYYLRFHESSNKIRCIVERAKTLSTINKPISADLSSLLNTDAHFKAQVNDGVTCEHTRAWHAIAIATWYALRTGERVEHVISPDNLSLLAKKNTSYESFKRVCFNLLTAEAPQLLVERAPGSDEYWDGLESEILEKFSSSTPDPTFSGYMTYGRDRMIASLRLLSEKCMENPRAVALKAFGLTVGTIGVCYSLNKLFRGSKTPSSLALNTLNLASASHCFSNFVGETVDEDRIPKRVVKNFKAETIDEERIPKRLPKNFRAEAVLKDTASADEYHFFEDDGHDVFAVVRNGSEERHYFNAPAFSSNEVDSFDFSKGKLTRRKRKLMRAEAAIDKNSAELISTTIKSNTYLLYTKDGLTWKPRVNMLFIQGRIAVMVKHAVPYLVGDLRIANAHNAEGIYLTRDDIVIRPFLTKNGDAIDLVSVTFPKQVPAHATLTKQFMKLSDLPSFRNARGNLFSVYSSVLKGIERPTERLNTVVSLNAIDSKAYTADYNGTSTEYTLRRGYMYEAETQAGDCTSPLVISNPQMPRKIVGLHVAGATTGRALALSVTQDMLLDHISQIDDFSAQVYFEAEELPIEYGTLPHLPSGGFIPLGKATSRVGSSTSTQIRPSKIHGMVKECTTAPAALRPVRCGDQIVDPMFNGLKKCGGSSPLLDLKLLDRCKKHISSLLKKFSYADKRILTHAEAISGVVGDPWLMPMNRRSSPGFPWSMYRNGLIGKTKWLGNGEEYILDDPELLAKCEERIEAAKLGKRIPPIWTDTLKDERRPIDKVKVGKTRVFSAGPMDYILNVRQYFLAFNAAMMQNRIKNEIALGVNPFGLDWHELALHLTSKGDNMCAGDFSNFDGSLPSVMLWAVCDIINEWYGDSDENQRIRTVLFSDIVNGIHINGDNVYQWTHSQPSGNPLTTIINCLINSLIFRYVFVRATGLSLAEWDKKISFISYGDDNVIGIHGSILDSFNQLRISEECAKMGFTYTDEAKTGELVISKKLSEIGFLKRSFRRNGETGMYEAPLELDTVLELVSWVRGDLDPDSRCADNVEIAYKELSLHGREIFEFWAPRLEALCNQYLQNPPVLYAFEEYAHIVVEYY